MMSRWHCCCLSWLFSSEIEQDMYHVVKGFNSNVESLSTGWLLLLPWLFGYRLETRNRIIRAVARVQTTLLLLLLKVLGSFGSWLLDDEDLEFGWDLGAVWDDDLGDPEELPSGSTDRLLLWKPDSLFKSDHSWRGVAEVTRASRSRLVVVSPGDETSEDVDSSWTGWSFACYCSLYKWFRSRLDQFAPVRIKCNRSVRTFCRRLIPPVLFFAPWTMIHFDLISLHFKRVCVRKSFFLKAPVSLLCCYKRIPLWSIFGPDKPKFVRTFCIGFWHHRLIKVSLRNLFTSMSIVGCKRFENDPCRIFHRGTYVAAHVQ